MNGKNTGKHSKRYQTDWKRLETMTDEEIDCSDIPELGKEFWENASLVMPEKKKAVSLRLDREVLDYFKQQGKGYQTKINAVLKAYIKARKYPS